jgi:phosphonopyruvate decarboxylase
MVAPDRFVAALKEAGVGFFCGVPDSLLKDFCAYLTDHEPGHVIAANEGGAVGLAAGHALGTGRPALVYMQNSGQGNAVNPLVSLADPEVYSIPAVLLVGWRGRPGERDEPQHVKQGKVTLPLFETLGLPADVLPDDDEGAAAVARAAVARAVAESRPVALVVKKGTFAPYVLRSRRADLSPVRREAAIEAALSALPPDAVVVSTTGMISREVYETRERRGEGHGRDFLTVGSMGHAVMIALGVARTHPGRPVVCLDGDGATLMQMGNLAVAGQSGCGNLLHVVFNNAAHDSVGGQPTAADRVRLTAVAEACGYGLAPDAGDDPAAWRRIVASCAGRTSPLFAECRVAKGARPDLGRPKESPLVNKRLFTETLTKE